MSMTAANMFWLDTLHQCNIDQSLSLPFNRHRLSNQHPSGRGISVSFDFGQDLSHHFLTYASSNNITVKHLALATYYIFLFKLTNGEKDLCIGMNIDNRYRDELKSIIGLFENVIPLRCQLDPHWSCEQLMKHVDEMVTNSVKYSYYPLQRILNQHPHVVKPAVLDASFEFRSKKSDHGCLCTLPISIRISEDETMNKSDFSLVIEHDVNMNQLSYIIHGSLDLFDIQTIDKIAQRFHLILGHLFNIENVQKKKPLYEISLILPDETLLMKSINNTQVLFPSETCVHHRFVSQVMEHPQKLAVELDDQSLTYSELLHYAQLLSLTLLDVHHVICGEIICQCMQRSVSMVSYSFN